MPTAIKQASKQPKRATKQVVKPPPPPEKPFLRFYHSDNLRARTLVILNAIEQAQDSTRYREVLSDLVVELTESGLDYYFLRPLKIAEVGFVTEQSAQLGMRTVKRAMSPVIRNVIKHMDKQQLLAVCSHIRQLMQ